MTRLARLRVGTQSPANRSAVHRGERHCSFTDGSCSADFHTTGLGRTAYKETRGRNRKSVGKDSAHIVRRIAIPVGVCLLLAGAAACARIGRTAMSNTLQDPVDPFQRGSKPVPPRSSLIVDGRPDEAAIQALGESLPASDSATREKIVELLIDVGRRTDPLTPKGADTIGNAQIVSLLAGPALAFPDAGRAAALNALRKLVPAAALEKFGRAFLETLEKSPSDDGFLLVAKAKPNGANQVVDRLAQSPEWRDVEAAKIARAALGARDIEDQYLAAATTAESAADGQELSHALGTLALIGTQRSLEAVARRLRTPLTIHMPGVFEKSVRLSVLDALLYAFPDQPVLYPNNIVTEADYTAAERFCTKALGVTYTTPAPPFLTYRGYPMPL